MFMIRKQAVGGGPDGEIFNLGRYALRLYPVGALLGLGVPILESHENAPTT